MKSGLRHANSVSYIVLCVNVFFVPLVQDFALGIFWIIFSLILGSDLLKIFCITIKGNQREYLWS